MRSRNTEIVLGLGFVASCLLGCNPYKNNPASVHDPSTVSLDDYGAPSEGALTRPIACPPQAHDGSIRLAWDTGAPKVEGTCQGGIMVGTWKGYYPNGQKRWEGNLIGGRFEGKFKGFYPNGEKRVEVEINGGLPLGGFKAWWDNGEVREKGDFVGGKRNGCWVSFYPSGQNASKGTYADGERVLTWLTWSEAGVKKKEKLGGSATHGECLITL